METKKKLTLRPLGNRVLVQRLEEEETLKGGIILPDTAKKKQESARVVAVGKGKAFQKVALVECCGLLQTRQAGVAMRKTCVGMALAGVDILALGRHVRDDP